MARQSLDGKVYLLPDDPNNNVPPEENPNPPVPGREVCEEFKIEGNYLIAEPDVTIDIIKKKNSDATASAAVGTGNTVTTGGKTYTVIKLGDFDGDGLVDTTDSLIALKVGVGGIKLNENQTKALNVNKDEAVDTVDALVILKFAVSAGNIKL